MYIRNYPKGPTKGTLNTAIFEDVVDMNPLPLLMAMFTKPGMSNKCKMSPSLPVGSAIEKGSGRKYASERAFVKNYNRCAPACIAQHSENADVENCIKECYRGFWMDKKCISVADDPPEIEAFGVPSATSDAAQLRGRMACDVLMVLAVALCIVVSVAGCYYCWGK